MRGKRKRKYEKRLKEALMKKGDFLLGRLRQEWDEVEASVKRAERHAALVRQAKASALVVGQSILILLMLGGVVTASVVAPNIFAAVGRITGRRRFYERKQFCKAVTQLKKSRYVEAEGDGRYGYRLKLTSKGAVVVLSHALMELRVKPPPQWDKRMRVVAFDIPNRHKWAREMLHRQLKIMGFYPLQESVFVYPYPCEEELQFVTDLLNITEYVRLMTIDQIQPDDDIRAFFSLK